MRPPSLLMLSVLSCAGCCFGGLGAPPPPPPPPPPIAPTAFAMDCAGLCQRTGACMDERGQPRGADELDCARSCMPGAPYASMPPESLACVSRATCAEFDACTGEAIAIMLSRVLGGGGAPPPPSAAPAGWPGGFPVVPGGQPMTAPPAGPVRVALLSYAGSSPDDLDARYHQALAAAGWTATPSEASPRGAHRFQATSPAGGTPISISIYADGAQTLIQTMQF